MHTIEVDDQQLRMLRAALRAYIEDFGHDEVDVLRPAKALYRQLPEVAPAAVTSAEAPPLVR